MTAASSSKATSSTAFAEGGCLCGRIRYRLESAPMLTAVCHCRHCQKQGGSAFSLITVLPLDAYQQTGETAVYTDQGDSGAPVYRHFCRDCGSPIRSVVAGMDTLAILKAGTLDDPAVLGTPVLEAYCDRTLPWVAALPGAQRYPRSNLTSEPT